MRDFKIICIIGQTATGKTSNALDIAKTCNGELINCDARQIYRKLDVVTGKDLPPNVKFQISNFKTSPEHAVGYYQLPETRIWLYDVVDPKTPFSSFDWEQAVLPVLADIRKRGKTPVIVGGTGFYLTHLLRDVETATIPPDWKLRKQLVYASASELLNMYTKIAPEKAALLNQSEQGNTQRLIRRIETARQQTKPNNVYKNPDFARTLQRKLNLVKPPEVKIHMHILPRQELEKRITSRVDERLQGGALAETQGLLDRGYSSSDPGLKTLGYPQLIAHLAGGATLAEARQEWITKELQYTKRQRVYFQKYFKT